MTIRSFILAHDYWYLILKLLALVGIFTLLAVIGSALGLGMAKLRGR